MGNQELLNYFSSYASVKARHSYGPQGHRGMSVLIFESSAAGYLEAARLHKHFKEQGRDKDAWDSYRVPFCPGGKRQLYGYIAVKEDLDIFNRHSQGLITPLFLSLSLSPSPPPLYPSKFSVNVCTCVLVCALQRNEINSVQQFFVIRATGRKKKKRLKG